ncbi:hypothetical protein RSOLAG1IB_03845 [Rhizoctonia solani AG-1 IB]|uniref:Uncharacterized protein n=1 Tax=Thanatephorus cucumeris (strain AG1-IB / isolate 7/3/14) TaxID=1108050 RepID=A0A0B7FWR3_THACB|nr:hypothetical protein RSOLAG1IB_03845 [Rhizoctonia solani AG-1 IB]
MQVRVGTAVSALAKMIAQVKEQPIEGVKQQLEEAAGEKDRFIKEHQETYCEADENLSQATDNLKAGWIAYFDTMGRGSPLHRAVLGYKNTNLGILNNIKGHALYKAELKTPGFQKRVEAAEKNLRELNNKRKYVFQQVRKAGKRQGEKAWKTARAEGNPVQIGDKDAALDYLAQPSSLVTDASTVWFRALLERWLTAPQVASSSRTSRPSVVSDHPADQIKSTTARSNLPWSKKRGEELEQHIIDLSIDEDLKDDEVTSSYREMRAYKQVNLGGRDLNEEVVSITEGSLEEQTDEPVEEWKDQAESEQLTLASARDVRQYLMMLALDPILLDREIQAQIEKDGGKIYCQKCRLYHKSDETVHSYSSISKLKEHTWKYHTDWVELVRKMTHKDRYMCPGACGRKRQFDTVDEVYEHCLSDECVDRGAFVAMKAENDRVHQIRYEKQVQYEQEGGNARNRGFRERRQLYYLANVTEQDLWEIADAYEVPRAQVKPYIGLMARNARFIGKTLQ